MYIMIVMFYAYAVFEGVFVATISIEMFFLVLSTMLRMPAPVAEKSMYAYHTAGKSVQAPPIKRISTASL